MIETVNKEMGLNYPYVATRSQNNLQWYESTYGKGSLTSAANQSHVAPPKVNTEFQNKFSDEIIDVLIAADFKNLDMFKWSLPARQTVARDFHGVMSYMNRNPKWYDHIQSEVSTRSNGRVRLQKLTSEEASKRGRLLSGPGEYFDLVVDNKSVGTIAIGPYMNPISRIDE